MAMNKDGSNIRGERRKIIYIDESAWVMSSVIQSVLIPMLRYNRKVVENNRLKGLAFEDFSSKLIETSSAYLKSCDYYQRFKETIQDIRDGYKDRFCCALSYKTAVRCGIVEEDFVLEQKKKMPLSVWEMEWNSKFVGETEGSYFPYDLTEPCRDFSHVEIQQPKNSMSRYVLSLDVATSEDKKADNACITVIKIVPKNDGTYEKYIVFIRTYHGYSLEMLAEQVRITCCRFPNIIKVIIDANAIGEGVVSLLNIPYVDDLGREYPPLIKDTIEVSDSRKAINIISAIKADNKKNENMAVHTLLFLENHSLHIPIPSVKIRRQIEEQKIIIKDDTGTKRKISKEEVGVYIEADGLQMEMGNIVRIRTAAGNYLYDVKKSTQHKDRYSSLAMALDFIFSLEDKNRGDATENSGDNCWGRSMNF
ncbi:hypothetical protein [Clostridium acetobutylicum]|nr:hypothetical protein [Clostridium acetobutylicum]NYC95075.1 hypothetical protein [Clostridium acetobutylicum]